MRLVRVLAVVALALSVVACSNEKKVGSAIDIKKLGEKSQVLGRLKANEKEGTKGGGFVGEAEQQQQQQQQTQASADQAAKAAAAAQKQKEESAVAIAITASGYDPYAIRVYTGGVISVTNRFTKTSTVTADHGEFDSGPIAPGDTWTYEPKTAGKFNFHDATRPFVVGSLEVLAR